LTSVHEDFAPSESNQTGLIVIFSVNVFT